jgi:flagellar motor switch protein FliN/FliY
MSSGPVLTITALNDVEVCVTVSIGNARVRVSDVLAFAEGTIVPLGANANAPVEMLVNGIAVAVGEIIELEDGMLAIEIGEVSRDVRTP